jgi:hypothetical protein
VNGHSRENGHGIACSMLRVRTANTLPRVSVWVLPHLVPIKCRMYDGTGLQAGIAEQLTLSNLPGKACR